MTVLAIDPGPKLSQFVLWDSDRSRVLEHAHLPNNEILSRFSDLSGIYMPKVCIEGIASYGMAVGAEVFETCIWIGRFQEAWVGWSGQLPEIVYRKEVKLHLCQSLKAKDANIRQALIDRFGAPGTKKHPGKLHGIAKHAWAALALAVTFADREGVAAPLASKPL